MLLLSLGSREGLGCPVVVRSMVMQAAHTPPMLAILMVS